MQARTYTYIDGESHYHRSEEAWQIISNDKATSLQQVSYADDVDGSLLLVIPKVKVFWSKRFSPGTRCFYFSACSADLKGIYDARVAVQNFELEPHIIAENKNLFRHRKNLLASHRIIEKPKGVDAALFVQLLDDAHSNRFDACHVYSSDADYGPVVEAVKALGKSVHVYGFDNLLGELSPLRHAASAFIDLEKLYRTELVRKFLLNSNGIAS